MIYNVYRKDRTTFGGGVFIGVRDNLLSQARPDLDAACETIGAEVSTAKEKPLIIGSYYRPPSETLDSDTIHVLEGSLQQIKHPLRKHILLCGDFTQRRSLRAMRRTQQSHRQIEPATYTRRPHPSEIIIQCAEDNAHAPLFPMFRQ